MAPIRIAVPAELIGMGWDVTGTSRISILEPCTSYTIVLLVEHEVDILQELAELVGRLQTRRSSACTDHPEFSASLIQGGLCDFEVTKTLSIPGICVWFFDIGCAGMLSRCL